MKLHKLLYITIFALCLLNNNDSFSQQADKTDIKEKQEPQKKTRKYATNRVKRLPKIYPKKKYPKKKFPSTPYVEEIPEDFYSVFTDFRIPVREEINESDLRYEGWETEEGRYTFRCKDEKRVRLTFWSLKRDDGKFEGSEFINITEAIDSECTEKDMIYNGPATQKVVTRKVKLKKAKKSKKTTPKKEPKIVPYTGGPKK